MKIGIMDSGSGARWLPLTRRQGPVHYSFSVKQDSSFFPYGNKPRSVLENRAHYLVGVLEQESVDLIVVACHTMSTQVTIDANIPVIDMVRATRQICTQAKGKVGVIATEGTTNSGAYQPFASVVRACPNLASLVEYPVPNAFDIVAGELAGLQDLDSLVLGCTHYAYLTPLIQQALPKTKIYDPMRLIQEDIVNYSLHKGGRLM